MAETFIATLITKGRRTGREHAVKLKAVRYARSWYFSRHRPDSDWFQNALAYPMVKITHKEEVLNGIAREITDPKLVQSISNAKYPNEERAKEPRVVIEVKVQDLSASDTV